MASSFLVVNSFSLIVNYLHWLINGSFLSNQLFSKCAIVGVVNTEKRVSQGFWWTREHGQFQLGNWGTKAKYFGEQGNMGTWEHESVLRITGTKQFLCDNFFVTVLNCSCRWGKLVNFYDKYICWKARVLAFIYITAAIYCIMGRGKQQCVGHLKSKSVVKATRNYSISFHYKSAPGPEMSFSYVIFRPAEH